MCTPIFLVTALSTRCSRPRAVTSAINRYYDPTTDEFLSVDADVAQTDQPYVFTNDDPLNAEDPLGLCGGILGWACSGYDYIRHATASVADWSVQHPLDTIIIVTAIGSIIVTGGADASVVALGLGAAEEDTALTTAANILKATSNAASAVQTVQSCTSANLFECSTSVLQDGVGAELEYGGASEVVQANASVVMVYLSPSSTTKPSRQKPVSTGKKKS